MSVTKKTIALILSIIMCVLLLSGSFAMAESNATDTPDSRFKNKTWKQIMDEFVSEHGISSFNIAAGYLNLVTGEENYYNGTEFMNSGSMFKVPLNMYYAEKVSTGEYTMDTSIWGRTYKDLQEGSLIYSDNEMAITLWKYAFGTFYEYQVAMCPYLGITDPEKVDSTYYLSDNYYTPKMVISFLKELWNNPDKYPGIIDCMKQADPEHWFESKEQEVEVAHKYGYVTDDWRDHLLYVNDCGFCYTEEPVAIVLFTRAVGDPEGLLADYCALAIDYNQYRTELDKQKAEKEEAEAALKEEEEAAKKEEESKYTEELQSPTPVPTAIQPAENTAVPEPVTESGSEQISAARQGIVIAAVAILVFIVVMAVTLHRKNRGR